MIKNGPKLMGVTLLTCAIIVIVGGFGLCGKTLAAANDEVKTGSPERYTALASKAETKGTVRIIVEVNGNFVSEPAPSRAGTEGQQAAISSAQDHVISELAVRGLKPAKSHKYKYIPFVAMRVDSTALRALAALPGVVSIEEDVPARVDGTEGRSIRNMSADVLYSADITESWNIRNIRADLLHSSDVTGAGMSVAILDTGVDITHPYLAGAVVSEACYSTNDSDNDGTYTSLCPGGTTDSTAAGSASPYATGCPEGECDHGTHVAGIVAGRENVPGSPGPGVAPGAGIIAIQVFTRFDSTFWCGDAGSCALSYTSDQVKALERVYELRNTYAIAAVNMSLSYGQYSSTGACNADNALVKAAIDNLKRVGIATIVSSGGSSSTHVNGLCGSLGAPACISSAISVGATDSGNLIASYSNSASFLTLFAPGSDITSSVPITSTASTGWDTYTGTSMAAPHAAGAWALAKQRRPTAGVADILKSFTSTGLSVTDAKCVKVTKKKVDAYDAYRYPLPAISVSPGALNFGSVKLSESSAAKNITIRNTGPNGCSSLNVTGMVVSSGEFTFTPTSCNPLKKGEACVLQVHVTPDISSTPTYGPKSGTLVINSDASKKPSITVKLSGKALPPKISVPAALNFPSVAPPGSLVKPIVIKNTGLSDLVIGVVSKTGDQFTIGPVNTCDGATVIKGGSCSIDVMFVPTAAKATYAGTISIPSNDPSKLTATVNLKGAGK